MKTKETKRVGISQKLRFEVFKRDSFKCQYCGRSAPDVLLHVDHINPVSKGGGNDLLNLTTACVECNQGKRDRLISDDSVMQKKRKQLEEMQEKQNQLQMMLEWEKELNDTTQEAVDYCVDYWEEIFNKRLSVFSNDKKMLHGLVKKYGVNSVIEAMDDATDYYYLKLNADDVYNGGVS